MSDDIVFTGDGQATTNGAIWFLIVIGIVGALTAMCVAIALPIGPWWMWLLAIVPFVLLARWELRRSSVAIEFVKRGGELRVRVNGGGLKIDEPVDRYDHWATGERVPVRLGGGVMMNFSVLVIAGRGRRIGFRQMGGKDARGWPERKPRLYDGSDVFSVLNIHGIEKALAAHAASRDALA
ncbi:MAG TPA: hypothetical protein VL463_07955 [Kofleriaceae bacterium]|nr:hypothetical protein [Kofleriaceae bacterium]